MQKKIKDDAISRQAAVDELDKYIQLCDKALRSPLITSVDAYATKVERASLKHYREVLELLEPAQPERKKGEWTKNNSCPFCGFLPWYGGDIHTLSFCPNCGAYMGGEQE